MRKDEEVVFGRLYRDSRSGFRGVAMATLVVPGMGTFVRLAIRNRQGLRERLVPVADVVSPGFFFFVVFTVLYAVKTVVTFPLRAVERWLDKKLEDLLS